MVARARSRAPRASSIMRRRTRADRTKDRATRSIAMPPRANRSPPLERMMCTARIRPDHPPARRPTTRRVLLNCARARQIAPRVYINSSLLAAVRCGSGSDRRPMRRAAANGDRRRWPAKNGPSGRRARESGIGCLLAVKRCRPRCVATFHASPAARS